MGFTRLRDGTEVALLRDGSAIVFPATGPKPIDMEARIRGNRGPTLERQYDDLVLAPRREAHAALVRAAAQEPPPEPIDMNQRIVAREAQRIARGKSACV